MRKVNFKVRNIGSEKYLSYVLDDETDLDEELLDYLDDNKIAELIDIIYEEDDENDYLTYIQYNGQNNSWSTPFRHGTCRDDAGYNQRGCIRNYEYA